MIQQHGRRARKKSSHRRTLQLKPEASQSSSSLIGDGNTGTSGESVTLQVGAPSTSSGETLNHVDVRLPPVSPRPRSSSKDSKSSKGKKPQKDTRSRAGSVSSRKSNATKSGKEVGSSGTPSLLSPPEHRGRSRKGSISSVVSVGSSKSSGSRKRASKEESSQM
jgi:hypothetical protein